MPHECVDWKVRSSGDIPPIQLQQGQGVSMKLVGQCWGRASIAGTAMTKHALDDDTRLHGKLQTTGYEQPVTVDYCQYVI